MQLRRAVVTGLGALTPIGATHPQFWEALINGVSGSNLITHFDTASFKVKFGCELKNYDPANYFDRKEARKIDPYAQYAMIAADEAIRNAGIDLDAIDKKRIGVIWASGIGGIETFQNEIKGYVTGGLNPRFNPFFIPKMI
jgi:3-oxoacyl-[acyl-carrier-protein] synthase II